MRKRRNYLWLIRFIGVLVPRRLRADWRQEWEAELHYREQLLREWNQLQWKNKLALLWHSLGALVDALALQPKRLEDEMMQDLAYGIRMLLKHKSFTALAVLTLALGIGANTALFSVVNTVLLKPLPYENPQQLFMVWEANGELAREHESSSPGNFLALQEQSDIFTSVTTWFETARTLQGEHDAEQVNSAQVPVEFFQTLGVQPALGTVFLPGQVTGVANNGPGQYVSGDRVVVISDGLWRRRFGADPALVGKMITINGLEWQVLGVMAAEFSLPHLRTDMWMPWDLKQTYNATRFPAGPPRDWRFLKVLARLKTGVTIEQAQAHLAALSVTLAEQYPKTNRGWQLSLTPFYDEVVSTARLPLQLLFAAVALVLLIACANVAGLLMARASARQREVAVRAALGASRLRLLRQLLTESVLLAMLGGALGLGLTFAMQDWLVALAPADVPRIEQVSVDGRVLLFTLFASVVTGIVFGLFPALKGTRLDLASALKESGGNGGTGGRSQQRFLKTMIVAEVAIALVLLVGGGLLMRSFIHLLQADPGFNPNNLLTMHITLDGERHRGRAAEYYEQLIQRLQTLPGVVSAAAVSTLPMSNVGVDFDRPYWREGDPEPSGNGDKVDVRMATPDYFKTMGMALLKGRLFSAQDRDDTPAVIIVNESLAAKVWPNEDPIGKRLMLDYNRGKYAYQVIGVTRGISYYGLRSRPKPELFIPHAQNAYLPMNVVIRTTVDPLHLSNDIKEALRQLDPAQPAHNMKTMAQLISGSLAVDRFSMWLLGLLSSLALLLAASGIYGVMTYAVTQRTREIGIRRALGAPASKVKMLVIRQAMMLVLLGLLLGVPISIAVTQMMKSMLFGLSATDPVTYSGVALLLVLVSLLACWLPARRAAKVDPMIALRCE